MIIGALETVRWHPQWRTEPNGYPRQQVIGR
jgi:hypothetical protein